MADDSELLRRYVQTGAQDAFTALVNRHISLVYSAALRQLPEARHFVEDVTQAVFVDLARNAATLSRRPSIVGWLYTSTHFAAAKIKRGEARRQRREQEAYAMNDDDATGRSTIPHWDRVRPVLDEVMHELDARDREAILLRYFKNQPFAEIGLAIGLTEDAARMRVQRALDKLHGLLAARGVTSPAAALAAGLAAEAVASVHPSLADQVISAVLADSSAATVGTGTFLTTMSTSKSVIAVSTAAAIAGLGWALYQTRNLNRAELELYEGNRSISSLRARVLQLEQQLGAATVEATAMNQKYASVARAHTEIAAGTGSPPELRKGPQTTKTSQSNPPSREDVLAASPEYRALQMKSFRNSLELKFGPFYRRMNLSREQTAALTDVLVTQYQENMEARAAAVAQGVPPSDAALGPLTKPIATAAGKEIVRILGPDGAREFSSYMKESAARMATVDPLAGSLYYTDTPLTLGQAEQLTRIIAATTGDLQQSGLIYRGANTDWENVMHQAEAVLTPQQMTTFRALREADVLRKQMGELERTLLTRQPSDGTRGG